MKIITPRQRVRGTEYRLVYTWPGKNGTGFAFPCDQDGNLLGDASDAAKANYQRCVDGTYSIAFDGIREVHNTYIEPATGLCDACNCEVQLVNQYCGACQCECGQWYNMSGQMLSQPNEWEE